MANSINATSTSNGGLITTGDDSGVLNIQTNETTAVSIDASQNATFTNGVNAPNTFGFKNRLINGGMTIDQRNAGASVTPTNSQYTIDRFKYYSTQNSKVSVQQNAGSVTPPAGFKNYLGVTSLSAYSVLSSDYFAITQLVEGFNMADLGYGASGAATVTLSFWVRSSLTGTFGGSLTNDSANYAYPFTYTISAANAWEQKSITITGATAGTWLSTNGTGIQVILSLGAGSTYSGTAGAWVAAGFLPSVTGATSVVGTSGATFYITGVQLEKGTQATSFDFRSYGTELALCQRYYERRTAGGAYYGMGLSGTWVTTTTATTMVTFATPKRTSASVNGANLSVRNGGGLVAITGFSGTYASGGAYGYPAAAVDVTVASGGTAGYGATVTDNSSGTGYIEFSSEL